MARQNQFYKGEWFGLPSKCQRAPFGQESACREQLGITPAQLKLVVAITAAAYTQVGPVSLREIGRVVDCSTHSKLRELVRLGWIEQVGLIKGRTSKLYAPTAKAWRELGLQGWSLLKEVA